jgi:hypothetical protein
MKKLKLISPALKGGADLKNNYSIPFQGAVGTIRFPLSGGRGKIRFPLSGDGGLIHFFTKKKNTFVTSCASI